MRQRIVDLFTLQRNRSLTAEALAADLADHFPDVRVRQVAYHVAVLRGAGLLPTSAGG